MNKNRNKYAIFLAVLTAAAIMVFGSLGVFNLRQGSVKNQADNSKPEPYADTPDKLSLLSGRITNVENNRIYVQTTQGEKTLLISSETIIDRVGSLGRNEVATFADLAEGRQVTVLPSSDKAEYVPSKIIILK